MSSSKIAKENGWFSAISSLDLLKSFFPEVQRIILPSGSRKWCAVSVSTRPLAHCMQCSEQRCVKLRSDFPKTLGERIEPWKRPYWFGISSRSGQNCFDLFDPDANQHILFNQRYGKLPIFCQPFLVICCATVNSGWQDLLPPQMDTPTMWWGTLNMQRNKWLSHLSPCLQSRAKAFWLRMWVIGLPTKFTGWSFTELFQCLGLPYIACCQITIFFFHYTNVTRPTT